MNLSSYIEENTLKKIISLTEKNYHSLWSELLQDTIISVLEFAQMVF